MKIRVYFEDTDIGGIVYHTKYINFCERARSELLFENGLTPFDVAAQSGYVVKSLQCNFLKTATLGDILEVETTLKEQTRASFTILQEIFKEEQKVFSMEVVLVALKQGKPTKLDGELLGLFKR